MHKVKNEDVVAGVDVSEEEKKKRSEPLRGESE